ncbi:hypothetical protein HD598_002712 [Neomicrococcus aestuarii]|uniref:Uncharacterized protein n=1 Tax=Neomicrococcus aestuarii TaxID=556325 RepID=A0A7W8X112_9MICC|nr:hypothetical protein [Neomicrococcus aestuarii]MBB5513965.1 hypothetical protein [Neomicrococcus aestuarii]
MAENYRLSHQAPGPEEDGTTIRLDQVGSATDEVFPKDVLDKPQNYGLQHATTANALNQAQGNPDTEVRIYRAVPKGITTINPGDWVSLSKEYAATEAQFEGSTIISATAQAQDLWSEGLLEEWGYHGTTVLSHEAMSNAREKVRSNFPSNRNQYRTGISVPGLAGEVASYQEAQEASSGISK